MKRPVCEHGFARIGTFARVGRVVTPFFIRANLYHEVVFAEMSGFWSSPYQHKTARPIFELLFCFGKGAKVLWEAECVRIRNVNKPLLVLASNSPRRRELLALGGWMFHIRPADVDESQRPGEAPGEYVLRLAESKARACAATAHADLTIVAADTAVVSGNAIPGTAFPKSEIRGTQPLTPALPRIKSGAGGAEKKEDFGMLVGGKATHQHPKPLLGESPAILGKPRDMAEAEEMLKSLRGRSHQVYTGIAVLRLSDGTLVTDLCITEVPMRACRDDEIEAYVATGDPLDKAGAYAIQNARFHPVEALQGCYASVMGLPLCHLARSLRSLEIAARNDIAAECQSALGYTCPIFSAVLAGEMVG